MQTITLRDAPEVLRIVRAAFPDYRKLRAFLSPFTHPKQVNSYWDGGSRNEYAIVELDTLRRKSLPTATHPYFDVARRGLANAQDEYTHVDHVGNVTLTTLPVGFVLVQAGTFCGKPATAHVFVNPENMTKFLAGTV